MCVYGIADQLPAISHREMQCPISWDWGEGGEDGGRGGGWGSWGREKGRGKGEGSGRGGEVPCALVASCWILSPLIGSVHSVVLRHDKDQIDVM